MPPGDAAADILPRSAEYHGGVLSVAGCDLEELASRFGTPLYLYDEETLRAEAREALAAFRPLGARVSYASKACAVIRVLRVLAEEGLGLDVVSEGELEAGLRAGFSPGRIHFHGNNKTDEELQIAVQAALHAIVVDNLEELRRLTQIADRLTTEVRVMIRTLLPIEARTHPHLQTSGARSKFGIARGSADEEALLRELRQAGCVRLIGIHAHVGSQLRDVGLYRETVRELVRMADQLRGQGFAIEEVSAGGGWAVPYVPGESGLSAREVASALAPEVEDRHWRLAVEPGRAIVARAGLALYRVGSVKRTAERRIVAVDGGMGDNPRPALYGARYTALLTRSASAEPAGSATVVGRYCESGDVLVHEVGLPPVQVGDLVAVPMSGAYQISMASGYNLVPQPAVVLVDGGRAELAVRRATTADLLSREVV